MLKQIPWYLAMLACGLLLTAGTGADCAEDFLNEISDGLEDIADDLDNDDSWEDDLDDWWDDIWD